VVAPLRARLADLAQDLFLVRGRAGGRVWHTRHGRAQALLDRRDLRLQLLHACRHFAHRRDRLGGVAALALGRGYPVAGAVLLGPQVLELRQQLAPALVEREQLVQSAGDLVTAPRERRPRGVRIAANGA
jgi:hypothetical protein